MSGSVNSIREDGSKPVLVSSSASPLVIRISCSTVMAWRGSDGSRQAGTGAGAPTAGSQDGYAAGFFTNRGESEFARLRVRGGMPADSFFASGTQGQRIVVAPARRLVVVRLGRSQDWETFDIRGVIRLVADVDRALAGPAR